MHGTPWGPCLPWVGGDSTAAGWLVPAQNQDWAERALLTLAEPREGEGRLCTLISPGALSGSLCSQVCFEDRRSGRPRSMVWGPDWDRLSHAGDRQVLWWGALAPSHPLSPPSPLPAGPAPLSHHHSPPPQTLLSHLPSPLPSQLPFMPSCISRVHHAMPPWWPCPCGGAWSRDTPCAVPRLTWTPLSPETSMLVLLVCPP